MALPDYAAFLAWAGAVLVVYAGASVANRMGWVSTDYRPKAAVMLLTGLLVQRAAAPKPSQSRVPQAVVTEAAEGRASRDGASSYVSPSALSASSSLLAWPWRSRGGGGCRRHRRHRVCVRGGTLIGGGHSVLWSKIVDETFIIAALMALRHPKSIVLSGALSALYVMTVLSTGLGRIVSNLISRKQTNSAATVLQFCTYSLDYGCCILLGSLTQRDLRRKKLKKWKRSLSQVKENQLLVGSLQDFVHRSFGGLEHFSVGADEFICLPPPSD